jgi:hypothetical protein
MARFTAYVQTDMAGSRQEELFEVPDDELEGLTEGERTDLIATYAQDAIVNLYDWGWVEDES